MRKHDLFKDQDQFTLESIMEILNMDLPISDLFGLGEAEKYLEVMANQDDSVITYDGGVIVSLFSPSLTHLCHLETDASDL